MKLFITDGTGFIGQHLLNELKTTNHSVVLLTAQTQPEIWSGFKNAEIIHGRLEDISKWKVALTSCDAVIHLASELKDESKMEAVNVIGAANLAKAAAMAGIKKFIHLSSVGVVGRQFSDVPITVDEQLACTPQNRYEVTKLQGENGVTESIADPKRLVILRPTNVFGEYSKRKTLLGLVKRINSGDRTPHSKDAVMNYVYAGDVARAIIRILDSETSSGIYNVGKPEKASDFLNSIAKNLGVELNAAIFPAFVLNGLSIFIGVEKGAKLKALVNKVSYDSKRLANLGGEYYGNFEGIKRTVEWYKSKGLV